MNRPTETSGFYLMLTIALAFVVRATPLHATDPTVSLHKIAWVGDPFPDRPGEFYRQGGGNPFQLRDFDASGDFIFMAQSTNNFGPSATDLLLYQQQFDNVVPLLQGFTPHPAREIGLLGTCRLAVRRPNGVTSSLWSLLPAEPDGPFAGILLDSELVAHSNTPVPGHGSPAQFATTAFGGPRSRVLLINSQETIVTWSSFTLDTEQHLGLYRLEPGQPLARVIDTTMPVPGLPAADWIPFNPAAMDWPFHDLDGPVLQMSDQGDVFWRGIFTQDSTTYRGLFRQAPDGTLSCIAGGPDQQIPNQPPGTRFLNLRDWRCNAAGYAATTGISDTTFDYGIYAVAPGEELIKIHDPSDPVPGVPDADHLSVQYVRALNNQGDIAYAGNYNVPVGPNGGGGSGLFLAPHNGPKELVLRYDDLPGQPPGAYMSSNAAVINDRGDLLISVQIEDGDADRAVYIYLHDRKQLFEVQEDGMAVDGMPLMNWALPESEYGGGRVAFRNDRTSIVALQLAGPDMIPLTSDDFWGLYTIGVEIDLIGDVNCDGRIDGRDIQGMVLALIDPAAYAVQFPDCDIDNADIDRDGAVTPSDLPGFTSVLMEPFTD